MIKGHFLIKLQEVDNFEYKKHNYLYLKLYVFRFYLLYPLENYPILILFLILYLCQLLVK